MGLKHPSCGTFDTAGSAPYHFVCDKLHARSRHVYCGRVQEASEQAARFASRPSHLESACAPHVWLDTLRRELGGRWVCGVVWCGEVVEWCGVVCEV